jgi:hypothetical protein
MVMFSLVVVGAPAGRARAPARLDEAHDGFEREGNDDGSLGAR